jgi:hypothetical protein
MKGTRNPTLSAYLLEKANTFVLYPQRVRSRVARKVNDEIRRKMVEWRKTFAPQYDLDNPIVKTLFSVPSLDELYCRELLQRYSENCGAHA